MSAISNSRHIEDYSGTAYVPTALLQIPNELKEKKLSPEQLEAFRALHRCKTEDLVINLRVIPTYPLKILEEAILDHCEERIQLFFQLLLLVYKTNHFYEIHKTDRQIGQGKAKAKSEKDEREEVSSDVSCYQAAHHATFPSLKYKQLKAGSTEDFVWIEFAKDSFFPGTWNTTVLLPTEVNQVDSLLDGKATTTKKLRSKALNIINHCASILSPLNPSEALNYFLGYFLEGINQASKDQAKLLPSFKVKHEKLVQENSDASAIYLADRKVCSTKNKIYVLDCYQRVALTYHRMLQEPETLLRKLCFMASDSALTMSQANSTNYLERTIGQMQLLSGLNYLGEVIPIESYIIGSAKSSTRTNNLSKNQLMPTASKYAATCLASSKVREAANILFTSLNNIEYKLKFEKIVFEEINQKHGKNPRDFQAICVYVLNTLKNSKTFLPLLPTNVSPTAPIQHAVSESTSTNTSISTSTSTSIELNHQRVTRSMASPPSTPTKTKRPQVLTTPTALAYKDHCVKAAQVIALGPLLRKNPKDIALRKELENIVENEIRQAFKLKTKPRSFQRICDHIVFELTR